MTDEQRKRIHDIEYSCDSRAELADRIVALEDERDKLRGERDYLLMNANPTATELRRIRRVWESDRDENARLRELAKAAWGCVKRTVSCDDCRIVACGCTLATAMRECGIEVDA